MYTIDINFISLKKNIFSNNIGNQVGAGLYILNSSKFEF